MPVVCAEEEEEEDTPSPLILDDAAAAAGGSAAPDALHVEQAVATAAAVPPTVGLLQTPTNSSTTKSGTNGTTASTPSSTVANPPTTAGKQQQLQQQRRNSNSARSVKIRVSRASFHDGELNSDGEYDDSNLTDSQRLDSTAHRVRGGGILASYRDVSVDPAEFAEGCKLLQAAALGDVKRIEALLKFHPDHVNFRDYDRRTALHVASSEGHLPIVKLLVALGAQVNRSDRWGGSPLDDAHRHRHAEVAAYLRGEGGTTGSADQTTNLITAAAEGDLDEVRMLLTVVAGPAASSGGGGKKGKGKQVEVLPPVDINCGDYDRRTALHLAAGEGHYDIIDLLCTKGADVNIEDRWGGRPLDDANRRNFTDCSDLLKKYGARPGKVTVRKTLDESGGGSSIGASGSKKSGEIIDRNLKIEFSELEMIDQIGSGAFGEIYKCRWRGILVAAKCIKSTKIVREWREGRSGGPDALNRSERSAASATTDGTNGGIPAAGSDAMDEEEKEMALADFRTEVGILKKLRHPNVCMLLAYSTTENFEVMVSELMKCSLLDVFKANLLHGTAMPKKKQIVYAQHLAQGMNYLHTCKPPIIHRDLKPANLLIDYSGGLKISDFGLAKIRPDPATKETEAFVMTGETGSYRFMAPEVFRHESYTETVDVYSFAMIFYYLLAGRAPWSSCNGLKAVSKAAIDGERPTIPREWDERLSKLLQQCWDENPLARPNFQAILDTLGIYSRDVFRTDTNQSIIVEEASKCNCAVM